MKLPYIILLHIFKFVVNLKNEGKIICIPNATFHIDCNRCKCSPTGISMDCTDWSCTTLKIPYDLLLNVTLKCRSGDIFLFNERKCLCAESERYAMCSSAHYELAHDLRPASGSIISLAERVDKCTPGIVFKNKCDTCICGENEEATCLGIGCIHTQAEHYELDVNDPVNLRHKLCLPHSIFSVDCNQCVCSSDGFSLLCDPYPCLGVEMRNDQILKIIFSCEAKSTFYYNEYECLCSRHGKYALCSLIPYNKMKKCLRINKKSFLITEFSDLCTPGMVFKDKCNICICGSNETAACTKIDCDLSLKYSRELSSLNISEQKISKKDIWVQKVKNSHFCRENYASMYCRYMRSF